MPPLTPEQRANVPGYARNLKIVRWSCSLFAFGLIGSWLVSRWLPPDTPFAGSGMFKVIGLLIPSVAVVANRCSEPMLATVVYGLQWLLAPVYLLLLFAMAPWSRTTRATVRYTARIRQISIGNKIFVVLVTIFLVVYYMGDFRAIPFPTLLNGGLAPDNDPNWWMAEIYRSYLALAAYSAIVVAGECFFFWIMLFFIWNFDIIVLRRGLNDSASSKTDSYSDHSS